MPPATDACLVQRTVPYALRTARKGDNMNFKWKRMIIGTVAPVIVCLLGAARLSAQTGPEQNPQLGIGVARAASVGCTIPDTFDSNKTNMGIAEFMRVSFCVFGRTQNRYHTLQSRMPSLRKSSLDELDFFQS